MNKMLPLLLALVAGLPAADLVRAHEHVLKNGLKVLMVEDRNAPLSVCRLYFKVGSVYEQIGKTGLSHMLEHMMFKGTRRVGVADYVKEQPVARAIDSLFILADRAGIRGDTAAVRTFKAEAMKKAEEQRKYLRNNELWTLYQKAGGTELNAWTGDYMTAYIVTLPRNKIELYFWLESDRMANPELREFYPERDVVMEERRLRYENSPYGRYYESLSSLLFEAHPYRIPTIGYMSDLKRLTRTDAMAHFKKYYTPNNAVLILVGDIDTAEVIRLSERYFGPVPRGPEIEPPATQDPEPVGERRLTVRKDVGPVVDLFYRTPGLGSPDRFPLDVIEGVLNGKSGRLFKSLVRDKKLCADVSASHNVQNWVSFFMIHAEPLEGIDPAAVEREIRAELARLAESPVSARELEKVKNNVRAGLVNMLRSNESLADRLAFYEIGGGWKGINEYGDRIEAVTLDDLRRAARTFFTEKNATVGWVIKPGRGEK